MTVSTNLKNFKRFAAKMCQFESAPTGNSNVFESVVPLRHTIYEEIKFGNSFKVKMPKLIRSLQSCCESLKHAISGCICGYC